MLGYFDVLSVSPAQVAANIAIVGLSLYGSGFNGVGNCVQLGIPVRLTQLQPL